MVSTICNLERILNREELNGFSIKPSNEDSFIIPEELKKRNFYLQLFRIYCDLPQQEIVTNFQLVYNDVFYKKKPITIQK